MKHKSEDVYLDIIRLAAIATPKRCILSCWCAPEVSDGRVGKNPIAFLITQGAAG